MWLEALLLFAAGAVLIAVQPLALRRWPGLERYAIPRRSRPLAHADLLDVLLPPRGPVAHDPPPAPAAPSQPSYVAQPWAEQLLHDAARAARWSRQEQRAMMNITAGRVRENRQTGDVHLPGGRIVDRLYWDSLTQSRRLELLADADNGGVLSEAHASLDAVALDRYVRGLANQR